MRVKALFAFKSKLFKPCKNLLHIFNFKLKKPLFIKALKHHPRRSKPRKQKHKFQAFLSVFHSLKRPREMDRLAELKSVVSEIETKLYPSPLTPAYIKVSEREALVGDDVNDACKSFENYLVEMMVEEGKVQDLTDIEEFLYCWKNLKCPVFIDLVSRFYGELCHDLFTPDDVEDFYSAE